MSTENTNIEAILAMLEAKREALTQAINGLKSFLSNPNYSVSHAASRVRSMLAL